MEVDLAADTATGEGADTLAGIESAIGSSFADDLTGGSGDNELTGGPGTDTLEGGEGDDVLTGGLGTDTVTYVGSAEPVVVDLAAGTAAGNGADTIEEVEHVVGSPFDDTIGGSPGSDDLGGAAGTDTLTFATAAGPVHANLDTGLATGDGADSLAGFEDLTGSAFGDTLIGDDGSNVLIGAGGDDDMDGGSELDVASFAGSPAGVTADLVAHTATGDGADALTSIEGLIGSPGADTFIGGGGPNVLSGGAGDDTIEGGRRHRRPRRRRRYRYRHV